MLCCAMLMLCYAMLCYVVRVRTCVCACMYVCVCEHVRVHVSMFVLTPTPTPVQFNFFLWSSRALGHGLELCHVLHLCSFDNSHPTPCPDRQHHSTSCALSHGPCHRVVVFAVVVGVVISCFSLCDCPRSLSSSSLSSLWQTDKASDLVINTRIIGHITVA